MMTTGAARRDAGREDGAGLRWLPPVYSPLSLAALVSAVRSVAGRGGDPRPAFARSLGEAYGASRVLLADSGTHALQLAIQVALRVVNASATPIVALPAFTCFDVATAAVGSGASIALYDVDPSALAPDLDSLERALNDGARVVVVTPLYGVPVDWDAVERCAAPFGALVIEDAAQGHGATWHERRLGASGRLGVLSFGRGKGWTGGCGGALLARDDAAGFLNDELPESSRATGVVGTLMRSAAQWLLARPERYALPASLPFLHLGETNYRDPSTPAGIPWVAVALLQATRALADDEGQQRRTHAAEFAAGVAPLASVGTVRPGVGGTPGYLRFPIRLARGLTGFSSSPAALRLGMATGYPATLAQLPAVRSRLTPVSARVNAWPGATELVNTLVTMPTHSLVTASERRAILAMIADYRAPA